MVQGRPQANNNQNRNGNRGNTGRTGRANRNRRRNELGHRRYLRQAYEVAEHYLAVSRQDEQAANALRSQGLYNQAAYFYLQSMEKSIKHCIASKIDTTNPYFADELKGTLGHSLDASIDLLLKIYATDENLAAMVRSQLKSVLGDTNFSMLHNNLRYPVYSTRYGNYTVNEISAADCDKLSRMLASLRVFLEDVRTRIR